MKNGILNGWRQKAKPSRTRQQIDSEYSHHALNLGHKIKIIEDLETEVIEHKDALKRLAQEIKTAPATEQAVTDAPASEPQIQPPTTAPASAEPQVSAP